MKLYPNNSFSQTINTVSLNMVYNSSNYAGSALGALGVVLFDTADAKPKLAFVNKLNEAA